MHGLILGNRTRFLEIVFSVPFKKEKFSIAQIGKSNFASFAPAPIRCRGSADASIDRNRNGATPAVRQKFMARRLGGRGDSFTGTLEVCPRAILILRFGAADRESELCGVAWADS